MKLEKYNISKAGRKYQDKTGAERTVWHNIGTLTEFYKEDGSVSRVLEIPAIGLEANVFPFVKKEKYDNLGSQSYENDIDIDSSPF